MLLSWLPDEDRDDAELWLSGEDGEVHRRRNERALDAVLIAGGEVG